MLNGLDLFSGIGGITHALEGIVRPIAYCEQDPYCQAVLLSRMSEQSLPIAPVWDDVRTLNAEELHSFGEIDIIYGGFPCQDISVAGTGKGLEGERSGLYKELQRLVCEIRPSFVFMENVPALTTRGLEAISLDFTKMGYDLRWTIVSAEEVGAPHKRERIWLLAHTYGERGGEKQKCEQRIKNKNESWNDGSKESMADTNGKGLQRPRWKESSKPRPSEESWWAVEPAVGRVVNGLPYRVDRIKSLGNSVVPQAAKKAFMKLICEI